MRALQQEISRLYTHASIMLAHKAQPLLMLMLMLMSENIKLNVEHNPNLKAW